MNGDSNLIGEFKRYFKTFFSRLKAANETSEWKNEWQPTGRSEKSYLHLAYPV